MQITNSEKSGRKRLGQTSFAIVEKDLGFSLIVHAKLSIA